MLASDWPIRSQHFDVNMGIQFHRQYYSPIISAYHQPCWLWFVILTPILWITEAYTITTSTSRTRTTVPKICTSFSYPVVVWYYSHAHLQSKSKLKAVFLFIPVLSFRCWLHCTILPVSLEFVVKNNIIQCICSCVSRFFYAFLIVFNSYLVGFLWIKSKLTLH